MSYFMWLYLALPCFVANMLPVICQRLSLFPQLNKPLDNGATWRGRRVFGAHKTVRGIVSGVIGAMLISWGQFALEQTGWITVPNLDGWQQFVLFGFLAGLGALAGDALESTLKRQLDIPSGQPLIVLDQTDYMLGFLLLTSLIVDWSWPAVFFLLLFSLAMHPFMNMLAYIFKIKKTYW